MAVTVIKNPSSMKLVLDCGIGENGKTIMRSKTFSNVKPDTTHEDISIVANAIVSLQDHDLFSLHKLDNTSIAE